MGDDTVLHGRQVQKVETIMAEFRMRRLQAFKALGKLGAEDDPSMGRRAEAEAIVRALT